jgi:hypothetical protein
MVAMSHACASTFVLRIHVLDPIIYGYELT